MVIIRIAYTSKLKTRSLPGNDTRVIGAKVPLLSEMFLYEVMKDTRQGAHYGNLWCEKNVSLQSWPRPLHLPISPSQPVLKSLNNDLSKCHFCKVYLIILFYTAVITHSKPESSEILYLQYLFENAWGIQRYQVCNGMYVWFQFILVSEEIGEISSIIICVTFNLNLVHAMVYAFDITGFV